MRDSSRLTVSSEAKVAADVLARHAQHDLARQSQALATTICQKEDRHPLFSAHCRGTACVGRAGFCASVHQQVLRVSDSRDHCSHCAKEHIDLGISATTSDWYTLLSMPSTRRCRRRSEAGDLINPIPHDFEAAAEYDE
jgi:hypothetical protein